MAKNSAKTALNPKLSCISRGIFFPMWEQMWVGRDFSDLCGHADPTKWAGGMWVGENPTAGKIEIAWYHDQV